jgi:hypothetical protein
MWNVHKDRVTLPFAPDLLGEFRTSGNVRRCASSDPGECRGVVLTAHALQLSTIVIIHQNTVTTPPLAVSMRTLHLLT